MATVREYLNGELTSIKLIVSEDQLGFMAIKTGVNLDDVYSLENSKISDKVLVALISKILITPDKSEGDWSEKYDRAAVSRYLSYLMSQTVDEVPVVSSTPVVSDVSYLW